MFTLIDSTLPGCYEIQPKVMEDARGYFIKVFHNEAFEKLGLETQFPEEYYSVSYQGVIRGLHFQTPPMGHVKVVFCVEGEVLDAVVDLRVGSPTYGQHALFELSAAKANSIYIPRGIAHGFCVLSRRATMVYKVSTIYSPTHDAGILWDSVNIPWPEKEAILSDRDKGFPRFEQFESPFCYE